MKFWVFNFFFLINLVWFQLEFRSNLITVKQKDALIKIQ